MLGVKPKRPQCPDEIFASKEEFVDREEEFVDREDEQPTIVSMHVGACTGKRLSKQTRRCVAGIGVGLRIEAPYRSVFILVQNQIPCVHY